MVANGKKRIINSWRPQPGPASRPYILLADDDAEMRTLLALVLRNEGYDVVECADGAQLLTQLNAACAQSAPQHIGLVITDMRMPGVNGLDILERLRNRHSIPPIILITAFGDEQTHTRARQFGAAASLDKPFEITCLLELVRALMSSPSPPDTTPDDPSDLL